eukprot:2471324-Amphidinium_carterae.1
MISGRRVAWLPSANRLRSPSWPCSYLGNVREIRGSDVWVDDRHAFHDTLSLKKWKHEVRKLLTMSCICHANTKNRGLAKLNPSAFDTFLAHHVVCPDAESHGSESFMPGGVNCCERQYRHNVADSPSCEHAGSM